MKAPPRSYGCGTVVLVFIGVVALATALVEHRKEKDVAASMAAEAEQRAAAEAAAAVEAARLAAMTPEERAAEEKRKEADAKRAAEEAAAAEVRREEARKLNLGVVWRYSSIKDAMTHGDVWTATVLSQNTVDFDFPYGGEQRAALTLRKHPRHGTDVMLALMQGQWMCTSYTPCTILVSVDGRAAQRYDAVLPSDNDSRVLFLRNASRFIGAIRKSKTVAIEATVYQEGSPTFTFETAGLKWK